ncbi:NAD(P)/FAD-dependent oxidoreductase [Truepera radiovictrix]|uniref:Amine oxidase n=1 Tax=Truepera radiovictrix (strain DSM 17093 / CIP 108686 / LMG 22925 / RQ-24) TaxID=649638 RepID=D7CV26_TRURR|nr:FAD-dependent oxidoreductase [Truepera radiovictrix]ADI15853.1 amine oxidase [Truepera radiovictrix DSM 17093]
MSATNVDVTVVGAGVGGLVAARALKRAGLTVQVFEKSRGVGGRAATRRVRMGASETPVDHGAQYFTARDARFREQVEAWLAEGDLRVWSAGFHTLKGRSLIPPEAGHPRYAFASGLSTLGKQLAAELSVRRGARVRQLTPADGGGWRLTFEDGSHHLSPRVLLNLPAPQAREVCGPSLPPDAERALAAVRFAPCLAVIAGYPDHPPPAWRGVHVEDGGPLAWIAHDSSKRPRAPGTILVLHATPAFSTQYLETPDAAAPLMLRAAAPLGAALTQPAWTQVHRWRYARVVTPHPQPYLDGGNGLLFCGDWCGGDRLEAAYLSGLAAAERFLGSR